MLFGVGVIGALTVEDKGTKSTVGAGPFNYDGSAQVGGSGTVTGAGTITGSATVSYSANADGTGTAGRVLTALGRPHIGRRATSVTSGGSTMASSPGSTPVSPAR